MMRKSDLLDALFPKVRQNILATMLLSPERRWYLSDLAKNISVTPSSLQRELASLSEAGLLERTINGNRVYYQANANFPLFPELQSIFIKTAGLAERVKDVLKPFWNEIDLAFIFGSVARGERTAQSDINVMLVGSVSILDLALPLRELEHALQVPVNVMNYTLAEFRSSLVHPNHFLQTVLSDKKIFLKGSEHELTDLSRELEEVKTL